MLLAVKNDGYLNLPKLLWFFVHCKNEHYNQFKQCAIWKHDSFLEQYRQTNQQVFKIILVKFAQMDASSSLWHHIIKYSKGMMNNVISVSEVSEDKWELSTHKYRRETSRHLFPLDSVQKII